MGFCYFLETQKCVAFCCDGGNVTHALHEAPNEEEQSEKRRIVRRNIEGKREREREEREGARITVIAQRYFIAFAQRVSGRRSASKSV